MNNARWAEKQMMSSLPVKYFHIVFTLPDSLNSFVQRHQKQAYDALFNAASSAILKLCANPRYLGATPGFTAVLHTWGQTMQFHPHLHVILTAGGISQDRCRFIDKSDSGYLLPVKALSRLFRGIFIDTLSNNTPLHPEMKDSLFQTDFFCYLEKPLDRSDNVVKYLARYANRVCISDSRIIAYDIDGSSVTFSYKDNRDGGKKKAMTIPAIEFMRRFLLHVLPKRFMKIRHYGLLHNRGKFERICRCRRLLNADVPCFTPKTSYLPICPNCNTSLSFFGRLSPVELLVIMRC